MDMAEYRKSQGITQADCASQLGFRSKSYISGIESGEQLASLETALRIQAWSEGHVRAKELRPDLADLIEEAGRPAPAPLAAEA